MMYIGISHENKIYLYIFTFKILFGSILLLNQEIGNIMKETNSWKPTFGRPVLPLVYIITAPPFLEGRLGGTGLVLPSLSTSEKDSTFQLLILSENPVSFEPPSSSK